MTAWRFARKPPTSRRLLDRPAFVTILSSREAKAAQAVVHHWPLIPAASPRHERAAFLPVTPRFLPPRHDRPATRTGGPGA